ncbi:MAG: hypothetical protein ACRD4X_01170 [Candidatus Acidiferrales bacterium]
MSTDRSSNDKTSSRRSFLKRGAILAVPLAAAAAPGAVLVDDGLKARLARLEDGAAIRELHQRWLRAINNVNTVALGTVMPMLTAAESTALQERVRGLAADHSGEPDAVQIAPDGKSAAGRFHCAVEIETPIAQDCTLAQMAHAQGGGFVRRTERRVLQVEYMKTSGEWLIAKAQLATA